MEVKKKKKIGGLLIFVILLVGLIVAGLVFTPWLKNTLANYARNKVITYVANNTDYKLTIDSLTFESLDHIKLHKVKLENKFDKKEFNHKNKYQTDWIKFEVAGIDFKNIYWKNWFKDKGVRMEEMILQRPKVSVYRDKRKAREPYVVKPLPTKFLRDTKKILTIPLIKIVDGRVDYEEVVHKGSGKVNFTQLEATLENFSSDKAYIAEHPELSLKAEAKLLDSVMVHVKYKAEINSLRDEFTLVGKIESVPASAFNLFLEPLANVRIKSGKINKLDFSFKADNSKALGTLDMSYTDLETVVLSKDDPKKESKLKTFIANLVIRDENSKTRNKSDFKTGKIAYDRKKNFSIFHYWLNSVKSGVFSIVTDLDVAKIQKLKDKK